MTITVDVADIASRTARVVAPAAERAEFYEDFYRDLHRNPELSFQEVRTAGRLAEVLRSAGFEVHEGVGRTGVVGILRNGDGPTVALRGDMDALPVTEETGLPYASTARGRTPEGEEVDVMHACGHDVHVTCLAAAAEALAAARSEWSGTVMILGQPAEELIAGAAAMMDDDLYGRFGTPDVVLGQHVGGLPAGTVMHAPGRIMSATAKIDIVVVGKGGHGSQPQVCVDPIVIAAHIVARFQSIVAREVGGDDPVVITVGRMHAGTKANIIPDEALLQLSVRAPSIERVHWANDRIRAVVEAECATAGAPAAPRIEIVMEGRDTVNDVEAHDRARAAHVAVFGEPAVWRQRELIMGSEDFGVFGGIDRLEAPIPTHFWFLGGMDPNMWGPDADDTTPPPADLPPGHSPTFAPVMRPTLAAGRDALVAAALAYL